MFLDNPVIIILQIILQIIVFQAVDQHGLMMLELVLPGRIIVPTPLVGGGTIYSYGFFLFRQFWPIDIFIVEKCEWYL